MVHFLCFFFVFFENAFVCQTVRCKRSLHLRLWKRHSADNKDCVIKADDRLPGLLNCPGMPCVLLDHKQWFPFFCAFTCIPKHTRFPKLSSSSFILMLVSPSSEPASVHLLLTDIRWISLKHDSVNRSGYWESFVYSELLPHRAGPKLHHIHLYDSLYR